MKTQAHGKTSWAEMGSDASANQGIPKFTEAPRGKEASSPVGFIALLTLEFHSGLQNCEKVNLSLFHATKFVVLWGLLFGNTTDY